MQAPHYATMLPQKNFSAPPPPVVPKHIAGLPSDYMGVPLRTAYDVKATFTTKDAKASLVLPAEAENIVASAPSFEELRAKYPTEASMQGKKIAVVGPLPRVTLDAATFVVVPDDFAGTEKVGMVSFPFCQDKAPALVNYNTPLQVENAMATSDYTIYVAVGFVLLIVISYLVARKLESDSEVKENVVKNAMRALRYRR